MKARTEDRSFGRSSQTSDEIISRSGAVLNRQLWSWQHKPRCFRASTHSDELSTCTNIGHCIASEHAEVIRTQVGLRGARNLMALEEHHSAFDKYCAFSQSMYRSTQAIRRLRTNELGYAGRCSVQCNTSTTGLLCSPAADSVIISTQSRVTCLFQDACHTSIQDITPNGHHQISATLSQSEAKCQM